VPSDGADWPWHKRLNTAIVPGRRKPVSIELTEQQQHALDKAGRTTAARG